MTPFTKKDGRGFVTALLALLLIAGFSPAEASPSVPSLTFVTFNAEWFGLGGARENGPEDEYRQTSVRNFFAKEVPQGDVYVFEEIVDPRIVQGSLVPATFNCLTYENHAPKHQHVVLCAHPRLKFQREPTDNNDIIDEVAIDPQRSRPALHIIIADEKNTPLVRVVGVHLKAYPDESQTRRQQATAIATYLQGVADPKLPVVITGDFNTFNDDEDAITKILASAKLVYAQNPQKFTFRTSQYSSRFDHFWISENLKLDGPAWTYEVCNLPNTRKDMYRIRDYNKKISDHCPVSIKVNL